MSVQRIRRRFLKHKPIDHQHLLATAKVLPTDYKDYGGKVERWLDPVKAYPDCSAGCKFAVWLEPPFDGDWCVCANPKSPRVGLLTFEHQAGFECFAAGKCYWEKTP